MRHRTDCNWSSRVGSKMRLTVSEFQECCFFFSCFLEEVVILLGIPGPCTNDVTMRGTFLHDPGRQNWLLNV